MTKKLFIVFLAAVLLLFGLSATCVYVAACAEETVQEAPVEPQDPSDGQDGETDDGAQSGLQTQYYDAIIAEWGTVEQYLLSLVPEDAPDVVKDGWTSFVDWTRENWVVLAAIGATVCVIIIIVFGKKIFDAVKKFFLSVFRSTNKQYKVLLAQNNAIFALLGDNPKFEEQRAALKSANEEMMKDE